MSARTILKHLHQQGRMTDYQFDVINRNLKARPTGEWIPVSERLPEDMQEVLVWLEYYSRLCMYQTYGFGYVCNSKWSSCINGETGWQDARIIAWMPLPKPYKGGRE